MKLQRTTALIALLLSTFLCFNCGFAATITETSLTTELDDADRTGIEEIFKVYSGKNEPGCATAVFNNGNILFSNGYGVANLDYGIPITDSTTFYMASVSKQVTAAAAGLLIIRGKLDPGAQVSNYIEDWPDWAAGVKVKHLYSHTSGLPDIYGLMDIYGISISNVMDLDDYMAVVKMGEELMFEPGSEYSYSNSGYKTLAWLIEHISGEKFSSFVDSELLKPLEMRSTHFHDDRYRVIPNRAISYSKNENGFRQTYLGNFQGVGAGGLYSTLKDWHRWESFWNGSLEWNGGITVDEAVQLKKMMTTPGLAGTDTLNYAMGIQVNVRKGALENGHSGSFMGFRTDYRRYPQHGVSMVTLCNRADANPQSMNRRIADIVLKNHFEDFLAPFEGTYRNEEIPVEFKLTVEDGNLKLNRRLSPNGFLSESGTDSWSAGSLDMVFKRNHSGEITGFLISTGRAREIEFRRKVE